MEGKVRARYMMVILASLFIVGCQKGNENTENHEAPAGPGGWLQGDTQEKFHTLAEQLRGFDVAMVETGYRYIELYWAGKEKPSGERIPTPLPTGFRCRPNPAMRVMPWKIWGSSKSPNPCIGSRR